MIFIKKIKIILLQLFLICGVFSFAGQEFRVISAADLLLQKQGVSLGYSDKYRQPIWVSYTLTTEQLQGKQVRRKNRFRPDSAIKKRPVQPKDYVRSGYDKGHLAPAADMTYSLPSMENSFLMTNISPQIPGCNRGIWKRIENQVRRWALNEGKLYIITGPIFPKKTPVMGKAAIAVPEAFYKVILDLTPPMKMIGFIVPNKTSKCRIASFAASVDEVERITGYDFFSQLDDELENSLEANIDIFTWK